MTLDAYVNSGIVYSPDDRLKCLPVAVRMVELAQKIVDYGFASIDEEYRPGDNYFNAGLAVLPAGLGLSAARKVFNYLLAAGGYTGTVLLEKIIIAEGFLTILEHYTKPEATALVVGSILGEEYIEHLTKLLETMDIDPSKVGTSPRSECAEFQNRLRSLPKCELAILLANTDNLTLSFALVGCDNDIVALVKDNVSTVNFVEICSTLRYYLHLSTEEIVIQQNEMLRKL